MKTSIRATDIVGGKLATTSLDSTQGFLFGSDARIEVGDRIVVLYSDDPRRIFLRLTDGVNDPEKGQLSVACPLGQAVLGAEEGDEIDFRLDDGRHRKALIEAVEKGNPSPDHRRNGRKAGSPSSSEISGRSALE